MAMVFQVEHEGASREFYIRMKLTAPFKYLGVNIGMRRLPRVAFEPPLERLRAKISRVKLLLFKRCFNRFRSIYCQVDGSRKQFLTKLMNIVGDFCEETVMAMGLPLAAWRGPCKSKDEGGLGFRSVFDS